MSWVNQFQQGLPLAALFAIRAHVASQLFLTVASIEGAFPMNPMSCKSIHVLQTNGLLEMSHIIQCQGTWTASVFTKKVVSLIFSQHHGWVFLLLLEMQLKQLRIAYDFHISVCSKFWANYCILICTHCCEPMNSVGSHGSLSVLKKVQMGLDILWAILIR